ncbi:MAG TPA: RDD family protein [Acidimicrobiales bacterium]|nr:RDD family protein [Acidimicrobiales bacterium]
MAVCAHCGAYVGMDDSFCQNCGAAAPVPGAPAGAGPAEGAPGPPPGPGEPGAVQPQPPAPAPYTPPPPPYPEAGGLPPAPPPPPGYPGADAPPGTFGAPPAYGAPGGGDWQIPGTPPPGSFGGPPMGAYATGPGYGGQTSGGLADWAPRAGGWIIDFLIVFVLDAIGLVLGPRLYFIFQLLGLAVQVWFAVQIGQTGQSPGMRVVGLRCVGQQTGQPIGPGMAIVRLICHIVDSVICLIGWLFPLWDKNRQTIADKICGTVVLRVPATGFSLTPPSA